MLWMLAQAAAPTEDTMGVSWSVVVGLSGGVAAIVAAIIAAVASIYVKRRYGPELAKLQSQLGQEDNVRAARVDYEYEARKRLYVEVGPVLFAAQLAAVRITGRITAMVDRLREGRFSSVRAPGWMADPYYQQSTAFRLFLPMVHCRMLSRRLAHLDLSLEPLIGRKFMTLAVFEDVFPRHFQLARVPGAEIPYDPFATWDIGASAPNHAEFGNQGLVRGDVERMISVMTLEGTPMEWHQFELALETPESELSRAYAEVREVFSGFEPNSHPVLWRSLIAFYFLAEFFSTAKEFTLPEYDAISSRIATSSLDGTPSSARTPESVEVQRQHTLAARDFIRARLAAKYRLME